ncbi:hypothetical protein OSB04_011125 [Centaurea solstitialis]|uniref:Retrovirus-related Pol polyprotein from transposon TNT 1-94-like beta-barrel domain-containing protein n=1 Tax=Centaurea solstitialis TaxID=347529 RepID=A0AA38TJK4_9ASTR|nr:hypothetical protein OSB04_011125 [Centaurea solstitialis]
MIRGTSVSDHVMKMKRHMDHLERLGHPVPLQLATDTILNSLSEDYRPFVINYNMNNMEKAISELHSMLKTTELNMGAKNKTKDVLMVRDGGVKKKHGHGGTSKGKGPASAIQSAPKVRENVRGKGKGKKVKPNKARTENRCFTCNEVGHWRQNSPKRHEAGSTEQITHQRHFLDNLLMNTNERPVTIPNGESIPVKGKGEVTFKGRINIKGVLFVPNFTCNLLSVRRLTKDLHCVVTFFPDFFVLQDLKARNLIGTGDCRGGLYRMGGIKEERIDANQYRRLVGCLLYLQVTRPDTVYFASILSQFVGDPRRVHMEAANRVLQYLKTTIGQGILLPNKSDTNFVAYCDADWLRCPLSRRSRSGYMLLLEGSPISWKSKKHYAVSHSSAKVEYRSMAMQLARLYGFVGC